MPAGGGGGDAWPVVTRFCFHSSPPLKKLHGPSFRCSSGRAASRQQQPFNDAGGAAAADEHTFETDYWDSLFDSSFQPFDDPAPSSFMQLPAASPSSPTLLLAEEVAAPVRPLPAGQKFTTQLLPAKKPAFQKRNDVQAGSCCPLGDNEEGRREEQQQPPPAPRRARHVSFADAALPQEQVSLSAASSAKSA